MYKAAVRFLIRRSVTKLNAGDYGPALGIFSDDAVLCFPGVSSWSTRFRPPQLGREPFATHRGRAEIEAFLQAYVAAGIQMEVEDVLVNGPPWRTRAAARVNHGIVDAAGQVVYANRAMLVVDVRWGKAFRQEDYEDTQRVEAYDRVSPAAGRGGPPPGGPGPAAARPAHR